VDSLDLVGMVVAVGELLGLDDGGEEGCVEGGIDLVGVSEGLIEGGLDGCRDGWLEG